MTRAAAAAALACTLVGVSTAHAHDGPPFPIVSDYITGPYRVSVWTDPDTTDDGSAGGQFWVRLGPAADGQAVPPQTRASVHITPRDRTGPELSADASPVRGDVSNQFAALVMDHEGRFAVHVTIDGPLGKGAAQATVDATYDTRPAPMLLVLYLVPFVLIGLLWGRLLVRRRAVSTHPPHHA